MTIRCESWRPCPEISENLRRVVDANQAGKGYKTIFKEFALHRSTIKQIMYKWRTFYTIVTLPWSGRPTKITPRARCVIVREVTRDHRETSRKLKASLAVAHVNVHEPIIRGTLSCVYGLLKTTWISQKDRYIYDDLKTDHG